MSGGAHRRRRPVVGGICPTAGCGERLAKAAGVRNPEPAAGAVRLICPLGHEHVGGPRP